MFNATYFTYDGVFSGSYGLQMLDFNQEPVVETTVFSPTVNVNKPATLNRFFHNGITYNQPPQHSFSIVSEHIIVDTLRREILSWLTGRSSFKELKIHQPDLEDYTYRCVFSDVQIIFINGDCHGFRVTAYFDSPYQYGQPTVVSLTGTGKEQTIIVNNKSDLLDEYVYPMVEFTVASPGTDNDICIINKTDNENREFSFKGLAENEHIIVDNELRHVTSDKASERLSNFSKGWLRLKKGKNKLSIAINGTVTISCPTYVMIGF